MKKAIKLINCIIFFGLVSNFSFAESYKNFVNEENYNLIISNNIFDYDKFNEFLFHNIIWD